MSLKADARTATSQLSALRHYHPPINISMHRRSRSPMYLYLHCIRLCTARHDEYEPLQWRAVRGLRTLWQLLRHLPTHHLTESEKKVGVRIHPPVSVRVCESASVCVCVCACVLLLMKAWVCVHISCTFYVFVRECTGNRGSLSCTENRSSCPTKDLD